MRRPQLQFFAVAPVSNNVTRCPRATNRCTIETVGGVFPPPSQWANKNRRRMPETAVVPGPLEIASRRMPSILCIFGESHTLRHGCILKVI